MSSDCVSSAIVLCDQERRDGNSAHLADSTIASHDALTRQKKAMISWGSCFEERQSGGAGKP